VLEKRKYSIVIKKDGKYYIGYCLEIPQARGQEDSKAEAIKDTKRAIKLCKANPEDGEFGDIKTVTEAGLKMLWFNKHDDAWNRYVDLAK